MGSPNARAKFMTQAGLVQPCPASCCSKVKAGASSPHKTSRSSWRSAAPVRSAEPHETMVMVAWMSHDHLQRSFLRGYEPTMVSSGLGFTHRIFSGATNHGELSQLWPQLHESKWLIQLIQPTGRLAKWPENCSIN